VFDLFKEWPTLASALQSALRRLPDAERLLPRAVRALQALLRAAGLPQDGSGSGGAGAAAEGGGGGGDEDWEQPGTWLAGMDDVEEEQPGGFDPRRGASAAAAGRQPTWRALLQQRQQTPPLQQGAPAAHAQHKPADGPAACPMAEASRVSAWRAVRQLPSTLCGLVEAVALLRRHMGELGLSSSKVPPIQKAVVEAARCAEAVNLVARLLGGAEWAPAGSPDADSAAADASSPLAELRLAPGADAAHDAARRRLEAASAQLADTNRQLLAAFGGGEGAAAAGGQKAAGRQTKKQMQGLQPAVAAGAQVVNASEGLLQVGWLTKGWGSTMLASHAPCRQPANLLTTPLTQHTGARLFWCPAAVLPPV
jgi:hypothetical protein